MDSVNDGRVGFRLFTKKRLLIVLAISLLLISGALLNRFLPVLAWTGYGGYCTDWAYSRWQQIHPSETLAVDGDAWQWYGYAQNHGMATGTVPEVGSVAVWNKYVSGAGEVGHVAIVEKVYSNTSFNVSEMNWSCGRWCKDNRDVSLVSGIHFIYSKGQAQTQVQCNEYDRCQGSAGQVFFIERGKKRYIGSLQTLSSLNQRYGGNVKTVSDSVINGFSQGRQVPDVSLPNTANNILVQGSEGRVFVMKNGLRRYLFNFNQRDPDDGDWYYGSDVRTLKDPDLNAIPLGAPMYEDGMFLNSPGNLIYLIDKSKRRAIPTLDTYNSRGAGAIHSLPETEIDLIPSGRMVPDVSWPYTHDNVLIWSYPNDSGRVYVMKDGKKHYLSSFNLVDINDGDTYYPSDVRTISLDQLNAVAAGSLIYNNGMLLSWSNGPAYIIERNKKRYIPDPTTLAIRSGGKSVAYYLQSEIDQIPSGRMVPDVSWTITHDGMLLQFNGGPEMWVMKSGHKQSVTSWNQTDPDGDWYYPSDLKQIVDTVKPITTTDAKTSWYTKGATLSLSCSDSTSGCDKTFYRIDADDLIQANQIPITLEGEHDIAYYSVDNAGNQETTQIIHIKIDKTPPQTQASLIGKAGQNGWSTSDATLSLTASDNLSGLSRTEYSLNNGATWQTYTSPLNFTREGVISIHYRSIDNAGNTEETKVQEIKIDQSKPSTTDNAPFGWQIHDLFVTLFCSDAASGCAATSYRLADGPWQTGNSVSISNEGIQSIDYSSTDNAGLVEDSKTTQVKLDKTAPQTNINLSERTGENGWYTSNVTVIFDASDSISGLEKILYSLDNINWVGYSTPLTFSNEGVNKIFYRSTDIAGNVEAARSQEIKIDKTPPVISDVISSPACSQTQISWKTDEPSNSKILYSNSESGPYTEISDGSLTNDHKLIIPNLPAGTLYYFKALSKDIAGNTGVSEQGGFTTPGGRADLQITANRSFWASTTDYLNRNLSVEYSLENRNNRDAFSADLAKVDTTNGVTVKTTVPKLIGDLLGFSKKTFTLVYKIPVTNTSLTGKQFLPNNFDSRLSIEEKDVCRNIYSFDAQTRQDIPLLP